VYTFFWATLYIEWADTGGCAVAWLLGPQVRVLLRAWILVSFSSCVLY